MRIPVAYCGKCEAKQPALVLEDETFIVGCVVCKNILNRTQDVELVYYDHQDLHKVTKWKFIENGEPAGELYKQTQ